MECTSTEEVHPIIDSRMEDKTANNIRCKAITCPSSTMEGCPACLIKCFHLRQMATGKPTRVMFKATMKLTHINYLSTSNGIWQSTRPKCASISLKINAEKVTSVSSSISVSKRKFLSASTSSKMAFVRSRRLACIDIQLRPIRKARTKRRSSVRIMSEAFAN